MARNRKPKVIPTEEQDKLRLVLHREPRTSFLAFDLEVDEKNHNTLLEVGYVLFTTGSDEQSARCYHYIIRENSHIRNDEDRDNRYGFAFGQSEILPLRTALRRLKEDAMMVEFLVTHSGKCDLKFLNRQGVHDLDYKERFDTQILDRACFGNKHIRKLGDILQSLGVSYQQRLLHNAGNDAMFTMKAFLRFSEML